MDRLKFFLLVSVFGLAVVVPRPTWAATPTVIFTQSSGVQRAGDTLVVRVAVDSGGQDINAIKAVIKYAPTYLQPISVTSQKQFWPLWPEEPRWDNSTGTITLQGGRPNGVVAVDAPFADITFRVNAGGLTQVILDTAASGFYLNDNHGTKIAATSQGVDLALADALVPIFPLAAGTTPTPNSWASTDHVYLAWVVQPGTEYSYLWSTDIQAVPNGQPQKTNGLIDMDHLADGVYYWSVETRSGEGLWSRVSQFRFQLDHTAPLDFTIEKIDPRLVGGNTVISWNAVDAGSGIASTHLLVGKKDVGQVHSPVKVQPEWQGRVLTVVVRDQAGNERRVRWTSPGMRQDVVELLWALGGVVVVVVALVLVRRRKR